MQISRDAGEFLLERGTLSFTRPVLGKVTVAVFSGDGEFRLTPSTSPEQYHLKALTDMDSVREGFNQAIFCFTDDTHSEATAGRKAVAIDPRAADALKDFRRRARQWNESPRSYMEAFLQTEPIKNIELEMLADLVNPKRPGFFSAYITGKKYKNLQFHLKPYGALRGMPSAEEVALVNVQPDHDHEGIWYLSSRNPDPAGKTPRVADNRIVQPLNYRIETTIGKNNKLDARTTVRFRAIGDGDHIVGFDLLPNLRVTKVSIQEKPIGYIQHDGVFGIVMPLPMAKGSEHEVTIEYDGDRVLRDAGGGNFSVGARSSWYPSVNAFHDQCPYELIFRYPKGLTLVSIGKLLKETQEGDFNVAHWKSEIPVPVAGFNYGRFKAKKVVDEPTGYSIEGFATTELPDSLRLVGQSIGGMTPLRLLDQALVEAQNSIRIYERWFGKAPYGRVAVTQQPSLSYGQSWPTLIYIPLSAFLDSTQRHRLFGFSSMTEFVEEVTAHEVAHQWWGHMVGWSSYRDQWISEGLATFSAGLYLQAVNKKPDKYLKYWDGMRERLFERNEFGRRPIEAGPLWMGNRLEMARNGGAYSRVVYGKGAYVIHMLRFLMWDRDTGDTDFVKMMKDFVQTHLHKPASTESFLAVVNKHMKPSMNQAGNGKMDWFFRQWVYGTEVPRYKFDYTFTDQPDGKCLLKFTLAQGEVSEDFVMAVPIYIEFDGGLMRIGSVRVTGNTALKEASVMLPKRPRKALINAYFDVLEKK